MMLKPSPVVVAFAGHMFDRPERNSPRFPLTAASPVQGRIRVALAELGVTAGYSSLACGADMLFAEAMLERDAELHVVLPFARERFLQTSVNLLPGLNLTAHFEKILGHAKHVTVISDNRVTSEVLAYEICSQQICELARTRAENLRCPLHPLVVWDGQPGDAPGSTASFVQYWENRNQHVMTVGLR